MGLLYPGGFFNSGVLLMDLDRMRAERSSDQLFKVAADLRESLIWPDQDALNLVFARRWLPLHPRWNTQNSFWAWRRWAVEVFGEALLEDAIRRPGIRHFEGPGLSKPWHYLCPYPGRKEYRAIWAETPWADVPLEDRTAATWFVRVFRGEMRYRAVRSAVAVAKAIDTVDSVLDAHDVPGLQERLDQYDWYHSIDVVPGVTTQGMFDNRHALSIIPFPDLRGKRCLDVGTCDGFYALHMERQGAAEVVAVDVPGLQRARLPARGPARPHRRPEPTGDAQPSWWPSSPPRGPRNQDRVARMQYLRPESG